MKRKVLVLPLIVLLIFIACKQGYSSADNSDKQKVEAGVEISPENFPDDIFRDYVADKFDENDDGILSDEEINAAKEVFISGFMEEKYADLESVQGIQYLTELEDIRIIDCAVTSVDFSYNKKLKMLVLTGLTIDALDVSKNTELEYLDCINIGLKEIDLSNNKKLKNLDVTNNEISQIDVSLNVNLERLLCNWNNINVLDVSNNPALTSLQFNNNGISEIDISKNKDLQRICCEYTNISTLDTSNNPELLSIYCDNTDIKTIDLTNNPKAFELICDKDTEIIGKEQLTELHYGY